MLVEMAVLAFPTPFLVQRLRMQAAVVEAGLAQRAQAAQAAAVMGLFLVGLRQPLELRIQEAEAEAVIILLALLVVLVW